MMMNEYKAMMEEIVQIQHQSKRFLQLLTADEVLPASQLTLLVQLAVNGGMKVTEIADFVGVTPGAVTAICDKLEKQSLVMRARDQQDRRVVKIRLTDEGYLLVESLFHKFSTDKIEHITTTLKQVNQLMQTITNYDN